MLFIKKKKRGSKVGSKGSSSLVDDSQKKGPASKSAENDKLGDNTVIEKEEAVIPRKDLPSFVDPIVPKTIGKKAAKAMALPENIAVATAVLSDCDASQSERLIKAMYHAGRTEILAEYACSKDALRMSLHAREYLHRALFETKRENSELEDSLRRDMERIGIDWGQFAGYELSMFIKRINQRKFICDKYEEALAFQYVEAEPLKGTIPVFVYWGQGFDKAPDIVKTNIARLRCVLPETFELHLLSDGNVRYWAPQKDYAGHLRDRYVAFYSDYLRCELLDRYGGLWIDSTVFVTDDFAEYVSSLIWSLGHDQILIPTYRKNRIGSWFIAVSERHSYGIQLMKALLDLYWGAHKQLPDYFMFHTFWEVLTQIDPRLRKGWESSPQFSASLGTELFRHMKDSIHEYDYKVALSKSPIHKLTYKYEYAKVNPDMVISAIIRLGDN